MEFIIAAVLFVLIIGAWVVLPGKPATTTAHASATPAESTDLTLTPTA